MSIFLDLIKHLTRISDESLDAANFDHKGHREHKVIIIILQVCFVPLGHLVQANRP